jgi:hypothetical protein
MSCSTEFTIGEYLFLEQCHGGSEPDEPAEPAEPTEPDEHRR